MSNNQFNSIIKKIQEGNSKLMEEKIILSEFERRYVPHKIENYLFSQDELKAEYMFACFNAIFRAKIDIGDPVAFCVRRGKGAILDYYRSICSQRLIKYCPECNVVVAYDRRNKQCKQCNTEYSSCEKEQIMNLYKQIKEEISEEEKFIKFEQLEYLFSEIIKFVESFEEIDLHYKQLAIEALKNKICFYDHARQQGKSHKYANSFKDKIIELIIPIKEKLILNLE